MRRVRMAHLAVVGSHSTNGVAAIHSDLLRTRVLRDFAELFPERFNNKTNGVTPRRWLQQANPALSSLITEAIGEEWITDLGATAQAAAARRGRRLSRAIPRGEARGQGRLCRLARGDLRRDRGPRLDLRQPDQAHSRIQAPAPQRPAHRRPLQSPAHRSELHDERRIRSSSRVRRLPRITSPSSSSSSSIRSPPPSTRTPRFAAA